MAHGKGDRRVLAQRVTVLVDEGEAIRVGIERESEVRSRLAHLAPKVLEMRGDGLRVPRERSVGRRVQLDDVTSERSKKVGSADGPGPARAIDHDSKSSLADARSIDAGEDRFGVAFVRARIGLGVRDSVPHDARVAPLVVEVEQLGELIGSQ